MVVMSAARAADEIMEEDIDCSASLAPVGGRLPVRCVPLYPIMLRSLAASDVAGRFSCTAAPAPPLAEKAGRCVPGLEKPASWPCGGLGTKSTRPSLQQILPMGKRSSATPPFPATLPKCDRISTKPCSTKPRSIPHCSAKTAVLISCGGVQFELFEPK